MALGTITAAWVLVAFNTLGTFNIGGAQNTVTSRVVVLVLGAVLLGLWIGLISVSPFSIVI